MNIDKESKIQELKNFPRIRKKLKKNNAFELNRKLSIRTTKIINFNRWFKKEHDYCLPFQNTEKIDGCRLLKKNFNQTKILCKNDNYLKNNLKNVNLESINVNNELSSSSLYAINVTTELLKDALIENKKTQMDGENLVKEITEKFQNPHKDNKCFVNKMLENEITTQYQKQRNNDASLELLKSPLSMDIDDLSKLDSIFNFPNNQYIEEQLNCDNENLDQLNDNLLPNFCRNIDVFSETNSKIHPYLPISPSYEIDYNNSDNYNSSQNQIIKNTLNYSLSTHKINVQSLSQQYLNIFNRYQEQKKEYYIEKTENPTPILLTDLLCGSKPKTIISPYTHRHLKPYILKDAETKPLWLKMLKEIKDHYRIKNKLPPCMESETIDYSYVRAKHIKSVNALAREFFWPGIDYHTGLIVVLQHLWFII
ncbi:tRNA (guanine(37)-N1)-methyltransferase isoform X2 [Daktulosphaira vitifoliae]|uniref:tRNA (guanine(37)-N1)-methyltransferase isoform X2 n=1 Tax=Daktulosphaira vitifoliae TaxID=58002 RepID=UPI0021AAFED0|nr:tRNA (guanine(37)-N1)-methyltransferase isoform X2 [Daktulosphaira vitifoliae]